MKVDYKALKRKTRKLFAQYEAAKLEGDEDKLLLISNQIVELNMPIVNFVLKKFLNRGENIDDIRQVGCIGLIKSVERYDIDRGFEFSTFASATIEGEIRRYFRDRVPIIKVPRALKELRYKIYQVMETLTVKIGHEPTIEDIAFELGVSASKIISALNVPSDVIISLDTPISDDEGSASIIDGIACVDENIELIHNLDSLQPALECLNEFELKVIDMRFWREMTQTQIANSLNISQMHVSRVIRKSLVKMRKYVSAGHEERISTQVKPKTIDKTGQIYPSISAFGITAPSIPRNIRHLNILGEILEFKQACLKDEFRIDELYEFMWSRGATIPVDVLLSFSNRIIFPARANGFWRFEPDDSPASAEDILAYLASNLEELICKKEVLA